MTPDSQEVVLDACVLFPAALRDTLLRLAVAGFFIPRWSEIILDELQRNLIRDRRLPRERVDWLISKMKSAFPEADVFIDQTLLPRIDVGNHDRHVVALRIDSDASIILTLNLRHFPEQALRPWKLSAIAPDEFLFTLYRSSSEEIRGIIATQAEALKHPPQTSKDILASLEPHAPEFAQLVGQDLLR